MISIVFREMYVKDGRILPNDIDTISGTLALQSMKITKIENLPRMIIGSLNLSHNNISKIENLPEIVKGNLQLDFNNITKIENLPKSTNGFINLFSNPLVYFDKVSNSFFENIYLGYSISDSKPKEHEKFSPSEYEKFAKMFLTKEALKRL